MHRNRPLLAISLTVCMAATGLGLVLPVRVLYARSHGASLAIIGAMASSYLLSNFLFQYPTGVLADRFGRKRVMAIGLVVQAVVSIAYLAVTNPVLFVLLRFFEGMVAASTLPAARALVADIVPAEQRGRAYGIFGSWFNAGFLLGPALGGLFASRGYALPFIAAGAMRLLAVVIVALLVPAGQERHPRERARASAVPRRALFSLPLVGSYLLVFGDYLWIGFDITLVPLWMRNHLGASVAVIGLAYAVWAVPNVIGSPFGGRVADRLRRSRVILTLGLAQVPMYLAYGLSSAIGPVIVVFALHGAVYAFMQPSVDANLAAASPPDARARTQGLYSTIGIASSFLAANLFTLLYAINFRLPLFVMGALFGLCVIAGGSLIRLSEQRGLVPGGRPATPAVEAAG